MIEHILGIGKESNFNLKLFLKLIRIFMRVKFVYKQEQLHGKGIDVLAMCINYSASLSHLLDSERVQTWLTLEKSLV